MARNTVLLVAGICTLVQATLQFLLTSAALAQYFCVVDLLRELPILVYIKILYFHNPQCGVRVNIGQVVDGMADQAFVLLTTESLSTFRTFLVNAVYLSLSVVWVVTSGILIHGGARNSRCVHIRWPWMSVMVLTFGVDVCATVVYITDTFHTRTLSELVDWAGGVLSGAGGVGVDTSAAAWAMVALYSRLGVTILFNIFLVICVLVDCGNRLDYADDEESGKSGDGSQFDAQGRIPRANLLRRVPQWLSPRVARVVRRPSSLVPLPDSPESRTPPPPPLPPQDIDKKQTVNFPDNLLSLPQRLENMIAEQQRKLDAAVIDTSGRTDSGRTSPHRVSQSLPPLSEVASCTSLVDAKGRRGTAAELQGQLPWSYIPATPHRMRDQLPADEELPPVPVPDYTVHPKYRKASVHRSGSGVSAMPHRKEMMSSPLPRYLVFPF